MTPRVFISVHDFASKVDDLNEDKSHDELFNREGEIGRLLLCLSTKDVSYKKKHNQYIIIASFANQ